MFNLNKNILYVGGFELPDKNAAAQRVSANSKLLNQIGFKVSFLGITHSDVNIEKDKALHHDNSTNVFGNTKYPENFSAFLCPRA